MEVQSGQANANGVKSLPLKFVTLQIYNNRSELTKIGANVARTLSFVVQMCSKWSTTGRSASKLAQKASKGAKTVQKVSKRVKNGSKGVKMGQKVPIRAN